jgi:hypothetical protein
VLYVSRVHTVGNGEGKEIVHIVLGGGAAVLRVLRVLRVLKVLKVLKVLRVILVDSCLP